MKNNCLLLLLLFIAPYSFSQIKADSTKQTGNDDVPVHLREIPRHNVLISGGILQPLGNYGDFSRSGLNVQLGYERYFTKNFGLSTAITHSYNEFFSALTDEDALVSRTTNNFTNTTLDLGLLYTVRDNRFQFDSFLRAGVSFLNNPTNQVIASTGIGNEIFIQSNNAASSDTALSSTLGVRFNYYFRKQVQLFFSPMYTTTWGDSIVYQYRPGQDFKANMSNLSFNLGVKIALGKTYSNGEQRVD